MIDHENYNCKVVTESGDTHYVYANWIHNEGLDQWKGWHCDAGNTRFYIDKNFDIWGSECRNDYLGNVLDQWNIKTNSICNKKTCTGCTDDLMTKKHKL
jgi:hypothetical protein